MVIQASGRSLVADAYERLRREVLAGRHEPGQRLLLNELAAELGVSLSVIREAVTRLASEELLEASPQQGFRVVELSLEDLEDLVWLRGHFETLALREAIANGTLGWESQLVATHHALTRTPMWLEGEPNLDWMTAHSAFHSALVTGSKRGDCFTCASSYSTPPSSTGTGAGAVGGFSAEVLAADHAAILESTINRDADRASELLAAHLERTANNLASRADALRAVAQDTPGSEASAAL